MKVSEIQISYKTKVPVNKVKITSSRVINDVLQLHWENDKLMCERFKIILLNRANNVKGIVNISIGGITGTVVDIRIIMATILKSLSCGVILAHNHPSGNLKPSQADIEITKKIKRACELMDISLLDHIVIGDGKEYYSFADNGYL